MRKALSCLVMTVLVLAGCGRDAAVTPQPAPAPAPPTTSAAPAPRAIPSEKPAAAPARITRITNGAYWDGGGHDAKWSTAANWSGDVVPSGEFAVHFDSRGSKDCVIDRDVSVGSLTIDAGYRGVVDFARATVTVTVGHLTVAEDRLRSEQATLRLYGRADQVLTLPRTSHFAGFENANDGGTVRFHEYRNVHLGSFRAGPGSVTRLNWDNTYVETLHVVGTRAKPARLTTSADDGNPAELVVSGDQTIAYAVFDHINADAGLPIDAGDHCRDDGDNTNVNFRGVKYWDGGGGDSMWTTARNWSGDAVPLAGQDVVFSARSDKTCRLDADATIGSLTIQKDYGGTFDLGTATLTLNHGDLATANGHLYAANGTLRFAGTSTQTIYFPRQEKYGGFENANYGGAVVFNRFGTVTIGSFRAGPGTTTKLNWDKTVIADFEVHGDPGDPATLCSVNPKNPSELVLTGSQSVSYVKFTGINAAPGRTVDGSDHCEDGGDNTNITFAGMCVWDGGGADGKWSTAANWTGDVVPSGDVTATFDSSSDKACQIDVDVAVAELQVRADYRGRVDFGTSRVTVSRRLQIDQAARDRCELERAEIIAAGPEPITLDIGIDQRFHRLRIAGATVTFTRHPIIDELQVEAGSSLYMPPENTRVAALHLLGTAAAPITLKPSGDSWKLTASGTRILRHVRVQGCQALAAAAIEATNNCTDLGGNVNWQFNAHGVSVGVIPAASAVSPICIEGSRSRGSQLAVVFQRGSASQAATFVDDVNWYIDYPLSAKGVNVIARADDTVLQQQEVEWTPTDLSTTSKPMSLRLRDALRLTAGGEGRELTIDATGDGKPDYRGKPGDDFAHRFTQAGTTVLQAWIDGKPAGSLTVQVVGVDLLGPIACHQDYAREKTVQASRGPVVYESSIPDLLTVAVKKETDDGHLLTLQPRAVGAPALVARLGKGGPIIAHCEVEDFVFATTAQKVIHVVDTLADGTLVCEATASLTPVPQAVELHITMMNGMQATLKNGGKSLILPSADFGADGKAPYHLYLPKGGKRANHYTQLFQDGVAISK